MLNMKRQFRLRYIDMCRVFVMMKINNKINFNIFEKGT